MSTASGFGLATATALAKRGGWSLHLLDLNQERGEAAAKEVGAKFYNVDVAVYSAQAKAFHTIFESEGRLDFVFANAGIVDKWNFYQRNEQSPPPDPDQVSIDIDLKGVVSSAYLAQHYFRLSKQSYGTGEQALVMTASQCSFYPALFSPMYTAAKHGILGFARAIAKPFYVYDKIRVNTVCPGMSRTNILDAAQWDAFPQNFITPIETVVRAVLMVGCILLRSILIRSLTINDSSLMAVSSRTRGAIQSAKVKIGTR